MSKLPDFGEVDQLVMTILVDNKADLIVKSSETIKYFTDKPLLAEHGFSVLLDLGVGDLRVLWDAGVSRFALIENMRRMEIDPASIDKIVLSHGHLDHYAAVTDLLTQMDLLPEGKDWVEPVTPKEIERWLEDHRLPLIAHPAAFRERWRVKDDGTLVGPFRPPPAQEWEALGARIVRSEGPNHLGPGCWTTGYIPRHSFEKSGRPENLRYRREGRFLPDDLDEDQAIVINVKGKGLVILSGCAHAGIVNTVNHAQEISGVDRVCAIIGGFHLARASDDEIERTLDHIKALGPQLVVPCHCTGFRALRRFADQMPAFFREGVVGATYLF